MEIRLLLRKCSEITNLFRRKKYIEETKDKAGSTSKAKANYRNQEKQRELNLKSNLINFVKKILGEDEK